MITKTPKQEILKKLIETLVGTRESTIKEVDSVSEAAIDAPGRNESRYDTSKVELGYLANSLSRKVSEMEMVVKELTSLSLPIDNSIILVGSLVEISANGQKQVLFLLPSGGGNKIMVDNLEIITISKTAPLFSAIARKKVGDIVSMGARRITIEKIQ